MTWSIKPIAIYYEHPAWFKPLFAELEKRRVPFVRLNAAQYSYNPAEREAPYSLVLNRMSPSAYTRGNASSIFYSQQYLRHLERLGVSVINGIQAALIEFSKAGQLELLASLGLNFPRTKVINHVNQVLPAAKSLRFPILVKANIGGSGAGILRFDSEAELTKAISLNQVSLGLDSVALVQEYIAPKDGHIVRVETVNGKFLYAIKVYPSGSFNLCPADFCEVPGYTYSQASIHKSGSGVTVEAYTPPAHIIQDVERIVKSARLDLGGVEYLVNHDGTPVYYDINALSNFVANATDILGFDPYVNLVDYIEDRLKPVFEPDFEPAFDYETPVL
ncbi:MAG: hypothetical protein KIT62_11415 [Cyclobacteriaceae bacterium]|nr:hypothetical protein [Cyclobacteriaceae bacterium]